MVQIKTATDRLVERLRSCPDIHLPEVVKVENMLGFDDAMRIGGWAWRLVDDEGVTLHVYSQYPVWMLLGHDIAAADVGDIEEQWSLYPLETGTKDMGGASWREYR